MNIVRTNSPRAWLLAARPKTLTGAVIPVLLGTALAQADGCFRWLPALLCALFACGMQVAANFINDLFDYRKGSDRDDRLGPERACAQGWITPSAMQRGIALTVVLSCLAGCGLLAEGWGTLPLGGWELIATGVASVLFAFLYTTCFSYLGLGDLLVLLFFGLVPVCGTYYVQAHRLTADALVLSLVSGLVIDTLLVVNNYRDRRQDTVSGKRTLIVRFGEPFGRYLYLLLGLAAWLLCFRFVATGRMTAAELLWAPTAYLWLHALTWRKLTHIREGRALNSILGETSRNMLLMGLLLAAALGT